MNQTITANIELQHPYRASDLDVCLRYPYWGEQCLLNEQCEMVGAVLKLEALMMAHPESQIMEMVFGRDCRTVVGLLSFVLRCGSRTP